MLEVCVQDGNRLQLMDEYYLSAKHVGIQPDAVTFNILLKANRLCSNGVRGKLVSVHLKEMMECGIPADSYTIVELLAMCAKRPRALAMNGTMTNKQVADSEFQYYVDYILPLSKRHPEQGNEGYSRGKLPSAFVFNTYLDVYASDGDIQGMHRLINMARDQGIIGNMFDLQMQNTIAKGTLRAALTGNAYHHHPKTEDDRIEVLSHHTASVTAQVTVYYCQL